MITQRITRKTVLFALALAALAASFPATAFAEVEDWQKGATIRSYSPDAFASEPFRVALQELADNDANFVTLALPWKQQDIRASEIYSEYNTPTEAALVDAIQYAHGLGLAVNLVPHLDTEDYTWRAYIEPANTALWFQSYGQMLMNYARIAEQHGVEMLTIGTELVGVTVPENTDQWRDIIENIRSVYSGDLTYSSNWGGADWAQEKDSIEFWDDLDYIGLAAYFYFEAPYTLDSLVTQWDEWDEEEIEPLSDEFDKPVLFTEVGYRSMDGALNAPWDWNVAAGQDQDEQALGYAALFEYWEDQDHFTGVHFWNWRTGSDPAFWTSADWATEYTPQRKPAEEIMAEWFAEGAEDPNPWLSDRATQPTDTATNAPPRAGGPR